MLSMTKDGVPIKVECISDLNRITDLLVKMFKPEFLLEIHRKTRKYGEVFFQINAGIKDRYPEVMHFLVHLADKDEQIPHGTFIIAFHIHKDHIEKAIEAANVLRDKFKEMNAWGDGHLEWGGNAEDIVNIPVEEPPKDETGTLQ